MRDDDWNRATLRRFWWLLALVSLLFAGTELAALAGIVQQLRPLSFHELITNPLFAIGFGSPVVLYASSLPRWREVALVVITGCVSTAVISLAAGQVGAMQGVIGLGVACVLVLVARAFRGQNDERTAALLFLLPSLVALLFTLEVAMFLGFISSYHELTFDSFAYAADGAFGFPISFEVGRLFREFPLPAAICTFIYLAPPPALVFVYALQVRRSPHPPIDVVSLLLIMGGIGYALYFVFPVAGPGFAFASFPANPPDPALFTSAPMPVPRAPRNGVPSLHMASALVAYLYARPYGRVARAVAGLFVIGTFLATMGTGEHYFVDLVVALPFTVGVQALLTKGPALRRAAVISISALIFAGWLWLMRFEARLLLEQPVIPWTLLLTTLAAFVACERIVETSADHFGGAKDCSNALR